MLPQLMDDARKSNNAIHINPHFRKNGNNELTSQLAAHINPLFLERHQTIQITNAAPKIYMNPTFLTKQLCEQETTVEKVNNSMSRMLPTTTALMEPLEGVHPSASTNVKLTKHSNVGKIICKSRTHIIRENQLVKLDIDKTMELHKSAGKPMIILSKRKLIRNLPKTTPTYTALVTNENAASYSTKGKYKLIKCSANSPSNTADLKVKNSFVKRYALRRAIATNIKTMNTTSDCIPENNKVQLLNINGVFYNSTKNTLERKESSNKSLKTLIDKENRINSPKSLTGALTIHIKGTKYMMNPQKYKLIRVNINDNAQSSNNTKIMGAQSVTGTTITKKVMSSSGMQRRIDIGGVTYISDVSSKNNVFERTTNHWTRAYINNAKQKSLYTLSKRLVKCNIPCPIYQFVGKCAAYERGKCSKLHDKLQVKVCNRFLRGECLNTKCLLSHNVCLAKMPVCKFFLEGLCGRDDCPYLHKKLSNNAEICVNFLRGFCKLADKCHKRHEFVCGEYERNGKYCTNLACIYCKRSRRKLIVKNKRNNKSGKSVPVEVTTAPCDGDDAMQKENNEEKEKNVDVIKQQIRYFTECNVSDLLMDTSSSTSVKSTATSICEPLTANTLVSEDTNTLEIDANGRRIRKKLGPLPSYIPLK